MISKYTGDSEDDKFINVCENVNVFKSCDFYVVTFVLDTVVWLGWVYAQIVQIYTCILSTIFCMALRWFCSISS